MSNADEQAFADPCNSGLTKREYLAAMAMQGLCANSIPGGHHQPDIYARDAVQIADALLAELEKPHDR